MTDREQWMVGAIQDNLSEAEAGALAEAMREDAAFRDDMSVLVQVHRWLNWRSVVEPGTSFAVAVKVRIEAEDGGAEPFRARVEQSIRAESRTRRIRLWPWALAAAMLLLCGGLWWVRQAADTVLCRVTETQGAVWVQVDTGRESLRPNTALAAGATVETGPDGRVELVFSGGTRVSLGERTMAVIRDEGRRRGLCLAQGRAVCEAAARQAGREFAVTTAHGEFTVLGTRFNVWCDDTETRLEVIEGRVQARALPARQEPVDVAAGQGATLRPDGPVKVFEMGTGKAPPPIFAPPLRGLSVIPGAGGFGMDTVAGSGRHQTPPQTRVVRVTNLNDSGPGSLRYALEKEAGPRTVVFEVSGDINLTRSITLGAFSRKQAEETGSYVTIAGQTAPAPGITLKHHGLRIERRCHDVLIQHLRIRPGDTSYGPGKKFSAVATALTLVSATGTGPARNVVVDHCSLTWSPNFNMVTQADDVTIRNCLLAECLHSPRHPKCPHSRGLLATCNDPARLRSLCIVGNLFARNMAMNPSIHKSARAVIVNNVVAGVNVGPKCDDHGADPQWTTVAGNVILKANHPLLARVKHPDTRIYFGPDNMIDGKTVQTVKEVWEGVSMPFGVVPEVNRATYPPVSAPSLVYRPVQAVAEWVLSQAGARPGERDVVDARIVREARTGGGKTIASQEEVGGWPKTEKRHRPLKLPDRPCGDDDGDGYTNLEELLHRLAAAVEGRGE